MAAVSFRRARNTNGRRPAAVDVIGGTADARRRRTPREQQLSRNSYEITHRHCYGVRTNIHWPSVDGSEKQTNGLLSKRNAHMIGLKINFPLQCRQHAFRLLGAPSNALPPSSLISHHHSPFTTPTGRHHGTTTTHSHSPLTNITTTKLQRLRSATRQTVSIVDDNLQFPHTHWRLLNSKIFLSCLRDYAKNLC